VAAHSARAAGGDAHLARNTSLPLREADVAESGDKDR
jgi:hypothetical protein